MSRADPTTFQDQFKNPLEKVTSFQNFQKDAILVVPTPIGYGIQNSFCNNLSNFVRNADSELVQNFWKNVAELMLQHKNHEPIWLSTSETGVSEHWLTARIDFTPKHYQYEPYKFVSTYASKRPLPPFASEEMPINTEQKHQFTGSTIEVHTTMICLKFIFLMAC